MSEGDRVATQLAQLLVEEHDRLIGERAKRKAAEKKASDLAAQLERERQARAQAEAQAQELSTLVLGDEPAEPARFIPVRRRLQRVL